MAKTKETVPVAPIPLPDTLYGYWHEEDDIDKWMSCEVNLDDTADREPKFVGVYKLTRVVEVKAKNYRRVILKDARNR